MRDLSIEEIKTAADPVAACKEQIRCWKISYSRYCGSCCGGRYYENRIAALERLLHELKED